MPSWKHTIDLTDLWSKAGTAASFEQNRDDIVQRIRDAGLYPDDIVLRSLLNDLAETISYADFDHHFAYVRQWADQDHIRVWLNTISVSTGRRQ